MTMRRALAMLVLGAACAMALAEDAFQPGDARRALEEAVKSGPAAGAAWLDTLLADGVPRLRARHVEAARAAVDLLPYESATPRVTRLLAEALAMDASNRDGAWSAAMLLRREIVRRSDLENGERFLRHLMEIDKRTPDYHYDLGVLLLDAGRPDDAAIELGLAFRGAPSNTRAAYLLANTLEQHGAPKGAVEVYDRMILANDRDFDARVARAQVLAFSLGDVRGAREGLDAAEHIARTNPAGGNTEHALSAIADARERIVAQETNRAEIRHLTRRLDVILLILGGAALGVVGLMVRFVRRTD